MQIPFIPKATDSVIVVQIYPVTLNDDPVDSVTSVTASLLDGAGDAVSGSSITLAVNPDDSTQYFGNFPDTLVLTESVYTLQVIGTFVVDGATLVTTTRTPYAASYDNGQR